MTKDCGNGRLMSESDDRFSRRDRRLRQGAAWIGAAGIYGAAQGLSAWAAQRAQGSGTRPQYEQFERPAFAPPGAVFPVVWSALNLTTATSAWRVWRAREPGPHAPSRREVLAWWALAVIIRSGYTPLAFGGRRLWAATADAALLFAVMARYASRPAGSTKPLPCSPSPRSPGPRSRLCLVRPSPRKTANWADCCRAGRGRGSFGVRPAPKSFS